MIAATRSGTLALLVAALAVLRGAPIALAEAGTPVGGTVESTLALSLGEPSPFVRVSASRGQGVYDARIPVEVTATDAPVKIGRAHV